jgi:hypothetical protein
MKNSVTKEEKENDEYGGHPPVITDIYGREQVLVGYYIHWLFRVYGKLKGDERKYFKLLVLTMRDDIRKNIVHGQDEFEKLCNSAMHMYCPTSGIGDWIPIDYDSYMDESVKKILQEVDFGHLNHVLSRVVSSFLRKKCTVPYYFPPGQTKVPTLVALYVVLNNLYCDFYYKDGPLYVAK